MHALLAIAVLFALVTGICCGISACIVKDWQDRAPLLLFSAAGFAVAILLGSYL
jgi:hypothetical protein